MKKITYILGITLMFVLFSSQTQAINATLFPTRAAVREDRIEKRKETRDTVRTTGVQLKKDKALQEIDRRIAHMEKLIEKINGIKKLTDSQKSTLVSQVQTEITALQTLRAKIEADTDPVQLQVDKKSIVDSHKIFALFIPRIEVIVHADRLLNVTDLMVTKTQDTALIARLNAAKAKTQGAIDSVLALTPSGSAPGNNAILKSARTTLKDVLKELNDIRKAMKSNSSSSL